MLWVSGYGKLNPPCPIVGVGPLCPVGVGVGVDPLFQVVLGMGMDSLFLVVVGAFPMFRVGIMEDSLFPGVLVDSL